MPENGQIRRLPPESPTTEFLRVPAGWTAPDMPADNAFNDVRWALGRACSSTRVCRWMAP